MLGGDDALALHPVSAAALGARTQPQHHPRAIQRGHVDVAAECRLGERDGHPHGEVVPVPAEQRVRGDMALDDEVAGWATVAAGRAAALQADLLPVGHPGRDASLHVTRAVLHARAAAGATGLLDGDAAAGAGAARRREAEEALVVVDDAAAAALAADGGLGAGPGAAAVTGAARGVAGEAERGGEPLGRVHEVQRQGGLHVGAALRAGACGRATASAATATAVEHLAEEVAQAVGTHVEVEAAGARTTGAEATTHRTEGADLVVLLALGLVAEHVVRRADLLEPLLGDGVAGVSVRVAVAGCGPIGLGDLLLGGLLADPEDLVVVLLEPLPLRCHPSLTSFASRRPIGVSRGPSPWPRAGRGPSTCSRCGAPRRPRSRRRRPARA